MATFEELMAALRKADAAGDTEGAARIAQMASKIKGAPPVPQGASAVPQDAPSPVLPQDPVTPGGFDQQIIGLMQPAGGPQVSAVSAPAPAPRVAPIMAGPIKTTMTPRVAMPVEDPLLAALRGEDVQANGLPKAAPGAPLPEDKSTALGDLKAGWLGLRNAGTAAAIWVDQSGANLNRNFGQIADSNVAHIDARIAEFEQALAASTDEMERIMLQDGISRLRVERDGFAGIAADPDYLAESAKKSARADTLEGRIISERIPTLAQRAGQIAAIPSNPSADKLNASGTFGEGLGALAEDPIGVVRSVVLRSAPQMAPTMLATVGGGLVGGPGGAALASGMTGAGIEAFSSASQSMTDALAAAGVDVGDPAAVEAFLSENEKQIREFYRDGFKRGGIIGAFDAVSGGIATTIARRVTGQSLGSKLAGVGAGAAVEAATEGAGEAAAQLATKGAIQPGEVIAEVIGGAGMGAPATAGQIGAEVLKSRAATRADQPPPAIDQIAAAMQPPATAPAAPTVPRPEQAAPAVDAKAQAKAALEAFARATKGAAIPSGSEASRQFDRIVADAQRAGLTSDEIDAALSGKPQPADTLAKIRAAMSGQPAPAPPRREEPPADPLSQITAAMQPPAPDQAPKAPAPEQPAPQAAANQTQPQPSQGDAGRYEILDEIENGPDGQRVPTGRKVRYDRETGTVEPIGPDQTDAAAASGGTTPPAPVPNAAPRQKGQPERRFLTNEETLSIETDAKTFQYKSGGDESGVTDRLKGVTKFDPDRAGQAILFRTADGRLKVADGHQRTGLAKRAAEAGQEDVGGMAALIYDEADGYTPQDVMAIAALKNIGEGSGTALDAARILRDRKESIEDLGLPPKAALVRDADGLRRLSPTAFGMVANGKASERDGAVVGRVVQDQAVQADILALLTRINPPNAAQAEMIARDAATDTATETQDDLFGSEQVAQSLYLERAKILDGAVKELRKNKAAFNVLLKNGAKIEGAGNKLDQDANAAQVQQDAMVLEYIQRQATMKGPISDALTAAARAVKSGGSVADARRAFVADVIGANQVSGPAGQNGAGGSGTDTRAPEPEREPQAVDPDARDDNAADGDLFAPAQTGKTPDQIKAEAEAAVRAQQSKLRKPDGNSGDAGPLFNPDQDLFDPPKEAPQTFGAVKDWADAVLSALKARIKRDGSAKVVVSRERVLQLTKPEQVDDGFRAAADGIEVRRNSRWEALGIAEADALAERLGLPSRFEAVPPKEQPAALSQAERVEAEAKRQGVNLGDADYRAILSALPDRATDEDIAAAVRDYAKYGALWAQMDSNARYDAVIKAKLANLVRSGNDAHVWRIADSKWSDLTEAQRQALMFEIPEPGERQAESKPDAMSSGQPRAPQTGAELIQQGRAILQAYSNADDEKLFAMNGTDLRDTPRGKALADALLKAGTMQAKQKVADDWVLAEGKRNGKEHLVVLDNDGAPLAIMSGGKDWVSVRPEVFRAADAGLAAYATHNHPRSTTHSPSDVAMLFAGFKAVVVITHKGQRHVIEAAPVVRMDWADRKDAGVPRVSILTDTLTTVRHPITWPLNVHVSKDDAVPHDNKPDAFLRLQSALFPAMLDRLGIIRYDRAAEATQELADAGFSLEETHGQISSNVTDRLRRAGLVLPEGAGSGGNRPADGGADAAPPGTDGADQQPAQDAGQSDGRGRVPAQPVGPAKTGNAALDGALDDIFGDEADVPSPGQRVERDSGNPDPADGMGGTDVPAAAGRDGRGGEGRTGPGGSPDGEQGAGGGLPGGDAPPVGSGSDPGLDSAERPARKPASGRKRGAGDGNRAGGLSPDAGRGADAAGNASGSAPGKLTPAQQLAAIRGIFKEDLIDFVAGTEKARPDTPEFKAWFGESKVVDADGEPLILWHGTARRLWEQDFDAFRGMVWASEGSFLPMDYAAMRANRIGADQAQERLIDLYMRVDRPFDADLSLPKSVTVGDMLTAMIEQAQAQGRRLTESDFAELRNLTDIIQKARRREESGPHYSRHDFWYHPEDYFGRDGAQAIRAAFRITGFDGIKMLEGGEQTWGAFDPTQVKSPQNVGTFDPDDPVMFREDSADPIDPRKAEALESIFVGALDGVNVKAATDRDLFRSIILPLRDAGMTREEVAELTPYLESFLANLRAGRVGLAPEPAPRAIEADDRAAVQAKADRIKPVAADEANIRATLPLLLPEQQDDVLKVERRFAKPDGHGMMITNGTGTGKTFSGGGVIKRFVQMGKGDILIVAPSEAVIAGWTKALSALDVPVNQLRDTKDAGQAVTITTYANLRDNDALASRSFDLVVTDESQNLMSAQDGAVTGALQNLRAITHRPADLWRKSRMRHAKEWEAYKAMRDGEAKTAVYRRLKSREEAEVARWAQEPRSKVLFLSATPFAYDKAVDYAEGYLFDYPKDGHVGRSRQSGQNLFMVQHFGYRIRYHKLTKPEAAVDSAVFEREFHEKLKRDGVLSGRSLQVDVDYDRKFVLAADGLGTQIDAVLKHVFEGRKNPDKAIADGYQTLEREISQKFNYLKRMQLLEAIKARAAIPDIEKHLALGRKVVVFHDYNVGGGFNPFSNIAPANDANAIAAAADLLAAFPDLNRMKFASYAAPVDALLSALGKRARAFNGTVPQKKRLQNLADFNTDGSGADVLVVQSDAGGAGISMHDLTGTHQRVLINLGMPTKPTTTLQEEGRILRVGTQTNAPFRYYTIGTAWERRAFATRIAERSGTVENLALGNEARDLLTGFIEAYEEAEAIEPGPDDGRGGKERDRKANVTSPFEKAKTHYFGRTKTTGRRDQRDGIDFYPTPEPLALKMVEWAGIRPNERVLEPSAGDGAIARYVPDFADLTMVEPSSDLSSRALLKAPHGKTVEGTFESYHLVNKAHVIVMNPPFGSGGATAMQHLAKAAKHLRPGGRIVALIPTGPSADKRFDAWWEGDDAKGLSLSAEVALPAVAFERAGTSVMTRLVIIDKPAEGQEVAPDTQRLNFTGARSINEFFDRLEQYDVRRRPDPVRDVVDEMEAEGQDATAPMPQPVQGPPLAAKADAFKLAQVKHAKTGADLFVATFSYRADDDTYKAALAVAKQHGGYYSKFRGNGAVPGFQFKSEADRQAFLDDMTKPTAGFAETAYHGTPHDFDRFSLDAMGTGEGAQAYGWGLYFAGKRAVSEWYRDKLSRVSLRIDGEEIPPFLYGPQSSDIMQRTQEYLADKPPSRPEGVSEEAWRDGAVLFRISLRTVIGNLRDKINSTPGDDVQERLRVYRETKLAQYKAAEQRAFPPDMAEYAAHLAAIDWLAARVTKVNPGRLFTVDIPGPETLLDWDAPLSDQPSAVQAIIGAMDAAPDKSVWDATTGQDFIEQLTVDAMGDAAFMQSTRERAAAKAEARRMASEALRAAGIPGHRYLDGSSRNAGEGSHNYVIYDDAAITILEKQQRAQMVREAAASTEEISRLMPRLRAELDRLDLKRVRLVADADARDWQGMFHVTGDGALEIVIGASMDPMGTLHHEVIHALRAMNLFTPEEWRALELAAERGWVAKHDIAARYPDLLPHEQIEEAIAEEFSEALAAKKSPKGSALVTAFNKIARLFRALRNVLNGAGYQTAEDIFGRILAGEISKRQAGNTGVRAAMAQRQEGADARFQRPQAVRPLSAQARAHRNTGMGGALFIPDRRVWEELTRATAPIWARLRNGAGGMSDGIDRARVYIQDRFLPVLRAQEAIERATGKRLPPEQRAYTAETTFSGKVGRHLFEVDEDFVKPIIRLIAASKGRLTAEAVGEWLYARHAIERNAKIASINPAMPDGGSGMTNAEAQQILADAAASPDAARLVEIGNLIDKLRERTLSLREDAGLITHDEASDWRKMYRHYVPLKGFAETDHAEAVLDITGIGKRFNVRGGESRRALGRKSEAFNPLQAAFTQAQEVAIRAEKNRVGQSLHELAKDYPSKALWEVKKPAQKRYFNRSTGLVETRVEDPVSMILAPNEMAVKISGEEHRIIFHDERLARAAGTVGADQMGQITRLLSMFSRFWSMTRTMLNPEFAVANAFRDFQTAQFNIQAFGEGDKGAIAKAMLRDWRKALSGSWRAQGNRYDSVWAKHYREFQKAGAQVSFWTIEQPETAKEDLDRRVRLASGTMAARALKRLTSPRAILSMRDNPALAMIERANIAVDNAIRLAAFVEARKRGWAVEDAAFLAKELTVNFNRRGEVGANMNALYPFFNAAVQGSVRTVKALTSRRVALMALTSIAAGMLNDLLNAWLSDEDDDGQLFYDKVPEYRNERNFHIVGWGTGQNPAAVPMPYGYNIFPYAGQNLGKVVRGVKSPSEAMGDVAAALFNAFSPVNGGSETTLVSPFFTDPLIEMGENADWTGTPIYPRYPAVGAPDSEVYFSGASEASKAIASFLNSATGGDFREAGWISVSPETIDHLSAFVTGSAGAFAGRTSDVLAKALKGDVADIGMRDIPFLRTLTSPVGPWIDRDQFYSAKAAVQDANADVNAYAGAGQVIPPDRQALADLYDDMLTAEREMNGKGDWNPNKPGALTPRPDSDVMKAFNRKYLIVMGKVKP